VGVENQWFPLTKPVAVKSVLLRSCNQWWRCRTSRTHRRYERAIRNGGHADIDPVVVAGNAVPVTSGTPSVWVDVEPAKLYVGVKLSDSDSGIAELSRSAYLGQPSQL